MTENKKINESISSKNREDNWYHSERLVLIILRVFACVAFLIGGLVLLALRIAGWSIIFGLPMVIFGSVFMIYTYDEVLSRRIQSHGYPKDDDEEGN